MLDAGYWVLGIGYWVLGIGYWVLGTGYWVLDDLKSGFYMAEDRTIPNSSLSGLGINKHYF
jgi:hypothetical protein